MLRAADIHAQGAVAALARQTDTDLGADGDRPGVGVLKEMLLRLEKDLRLVERVDVDDEASSVAKEHAVLRLSKVRDRLEVVVGGLEREEREEAARREAAEAKDEGMDGAATERSPLAADGASSDGVDSGVAKADASVVDVSKVKDTILEGRDKLIRRASNVGAGLGDTVSGYVRDDGSVDLEKVRSNVRGGIDKFGETWQRLNGQEPRMKEEVANELGVITGEVTQVPHAEKSVPLRDEAKIARLRSEIGKLEDMLSEASKAREGLLRKEDQLGKLIRAREIRAMDDNVSAVRRTLAVRVMQLESENIFVSLSEEVESSSFELMDQRVMIAEFGDIDERLESLAVFLDTNEPSLIEDDEVGVLASDIQDLKMRLGLDAPLYSSRLDAVAVRQTIKGVILKARAGVDFYFRGMKLFGGDFGYALRLFRRVFVGYTLSPREVRTVRRTGRDLLTLIPFTVILILPLTPVGHVLIFGFIQRYWPDFFPSTFTERRQALMRRHEKLAKSIEEEGEPVLATGDSSEREEQEKKKFGLLERFGLTDSDSADGADGSAVGSSKPGRPADVLSSFAEDASKGAPGVATRMRKRGSRAVLDDLHLAD